VVPTTLVNKTEHIKSISKYNTDLEVFYLLDSIFCVDLFNWKCKVMFVANFTTLKFISHNDCMDHEIYKV